MLVLDEELFENRQRLTEIVTAEAPELLELRGVGAVTAAIILTVWSHLDASVAKRPSPRSPALHQSPPRPATPCVTASTAAATAGSTGH